MPFTMVPKDDAFVHETVRPNGDERPHLGYFGKYSAQAPNQRHGPQGFIAHLHNRVLRAHFHPVDQFQILLGGPTSLYQGHKIPAMVVHYADAYSAYGPLSGGDPPMRFFTLRAEPGGFIAFVPEESDRLAWLGRRNEHRNFEHLTSSEYPERGTTLVEPIFERDNDGREALAVLAGPGTTITLPGTGGTNGQFVFVADGSIDFKDTKCGVESLGWQPRDEGPMKINAGSDGARLFVLRFPFPSTIVQHNEADLQKQQLGTTDSP